ncbi:MAG TPA: hypothetical protein VE175_02175 [Woeseiaceae bacterium]|jgi:hypothetical protein|nr:hypothetical protein [Woeseiaceae bacterium]
MRGMATVLLAAVSLGGCAGPGQLTVNTESTDFSLDPAVLYRQGIGFLTPIAATGEEANRVSLALAFASSLTDLHENLHVVSLAEVLSAVNRAGLSDDYKSMMDDYDATGIMEKETLAQVGRLSGARYLGLLQLADFEQSTNKRFGLAGLRLMDTKIASIRLSWQIWDSVTGSIAWEGTDEIHYAYDTGRERPVSFGYVAGKAARNLISEMPLEAVVPEDTAAASIAR